MCSKLLTSRSTFRMRIQSRCSLELFATRIRNDRPVFSFVNDVRRQSRRPSTTKIVVWWMSPAAFFLKIIPITAHLLELTHIELKLVDHQRNADVFIRIQVGPIRILHHFAQRSLKMCLVRFLKRIIWFNNIFVSPQQSSANTSMR